MFKRILSALVLTAVTAASANAAAVETKIPNMPKIARADKVLEIPVTERATLVAKSAVSSMSGNAVEFPAELFPDIWMYSSGYAIYVAASGKFPSAESGIEFGQKVVIDASPNGGSAFGWVNTIPVVQQLAHDRWWLKAYASDRFDENKKIADLWVPGVHTFKVKVPYKVAEVDIDLVYDFQYTVGSFVFWTMPCLQSDGRVGLDLFIKALPTIVIVPGETQVDFLVDGWSVGIGTIGTSEYSTEEWPYYASVPLASVEEYDDLLAYTVREVSLSIFGADARVLQEFSPSRFLPVCETGGGKG